MSQYKVLYCDSGLGMLARRQALGTRLGAQAGALACADVGAQARVLGRAGEQLLGAQAWGAVGAHACGARGKARGARQVWQARGRQARGRQARRARAGCAAGRRWACGVGRQRGARAGQVGSAGRAAGRRWVRGARTGWPWAVHSVHSAFFGPVQLGTFLSQIF